MTRLVDCFTNYRSRYGYPPVAAARAEFWWRLEHAPFGERVRSYGYRRRKVAEHAASQQARPVGAKRP